MRATFQNSGTALSIGVFFSLMIAGLASSLPKTLTSGLQHQGVPASVAHQIGALPPVSSLFAAVLECSAAPGAFAEGLAVLEPGGTCVEVALTPEMASLPLFGMLSEGLHIAGACAFSDDTYRESVAHLAAGRVPVERLVSERVTLDDTPSALKRLQTPGSLVRILSRPSG